MSKTAAARIRTHERSIEALKLRMGGMQITEIAKKLGVSITTASIYVNKAWDEYKRSCAEDACEAAAMDLARLDKLLESYWDDAIAGNLQAAAFCRKILKDREYIYGYHKPVTQRIEVSQDMSPEVIEAQLLKRLEQLPEIQIEHSNKES